MVRLENLTKYFLKQEPNLNLSSISHQTVTKLLFSKSSIDRVLEAVLTDYYKILSKW